jgi:2'-5' RNA ligase
MRVFYAIELADDIKQYLKDVQDIVKSTAVSGNFTHYQNFHITLKYIGNIYNGEYEELCQVMDDIATSIKPFSIRIGDLGAFHKKNSSILWVGVTSGRAALKNLYNQLESEVATSGFEADNRKYRPHITIGKKVILSNGSFTTKMPYYDHDITVKQITLFQSHRVEGVLTYTPLYRVNLTGE